MQKMLLTLSLISALGTSGYAADTMTCTDHDGKTVELKAKDDKAKEKECKGLKGTWAKQTPAPATAPKKEEAAGKSGGW